LNYILDIENPNITWNIIYNNLDQKWDWYSISKKSIIKYNGKRKRKEKWENNFF